MMLPVISLPKDTPLQRSSTNPEVLAASAFPMTTVLMTDLDHPKLRPLQPNNRLKPLELLRHLQTRIPAHGVRRLLNSKRHLKQANRRNKRSQMLDPDPSPASSTLATHQEESPTSPLAESQINRHVQINDEKSVVSLTKILYNLFIFVLKDFHEVGVLGFWGDRKTHV